MIKCAESEVIVKCVKTKWYNTSKVIRTSYSISGFGVSLGELVNFMNYEKIKMNIYEIIRTLSDISILLSNCD